MSKRAITGQLTSAAAGNSAAMSEGQCNVTVWGTFVGAVRLERSFDGGTTWHPLTDEYGSGISWTAPVSIVASVPEAGVAHRINCTSYTSGTINYRISQ